jgi:hypothetical protein
MYSVPFIGKEHINFPEDTKNVVIRDWMEAKGANFTYDASMVSLSILLQVNRKNLGKVFLEDDGDTVAQLTRAQFWEKLAEIGVTPTTREVQLIESILDP